MGDPVKRWHEVELYATVIFNILIVVVVIVKSACVIKEHRTLTPTSVRFLGLI